MDYEYIRIWNLYLESVVMCSNDHKLFLNAKKIKMK